TSPTAPPLLTYTSPTTEEPTTTTTPPNSNGLTESSLSLAPPPNGFTLSTSSDVHNGKMSAADFDNFEGKGDAAKFHFVTGNEATYDSDSSSDYIQIMVARLASRADVASMKTGLRILAGRTMGPSGGWTTAKLTQIAGLPDALLASETQPESD